MLPGTGLRLRAVDDVEDLGAAEADDLHSTHAREAKRGHGPTDAAHRGPRGEGAGPGRSPSSELDGETVPVPVCRAALEEIADSTGGSYTQAVTQEEHEQVYADLGSQIGYTSEPQDVNYWFVRVGVLLPLVGAALSLLWTNRLV